MKDGMTFRLVLLPKQEFRRSLQAQLETNESIPPHVFHLHPLGVPNMSLKPGLIACETHRKTRSTRGNMFTDVVASRGIQYGSLALFSPA